MPGKVVFDIETLAMPFESFDADQQEYLLKFAVDDKGRAEAMERLSLGPLTARVIAIAMMNPDTQRGQVFYEHPGGERWTDEQALVEYLPVEDEKAILTHFWNAVARFSQFITFNGRSFDCPFLITRSAVHGIPMTRNLMPYRYDVKEHYDLMEQMTFYGASRKYSLDFICKSFGIHSPKADGITGKDLASLHAAGRYPDIARYCLGDVIATAELHRRWTAIQPA
jgi:3'-5' exonuclease